jgi:sec-independent protein translocase protein TatB
MFSLSPAKLMVVLVIALVVLGPEKLPQVARQLGAFWGDIRKWRTRIESEVRSTFPDLPPTHEVVQAVRSPLSFLDRLADVHEGANSPADANGTAGAAQDTTANGNRARGDSVSGEASGQGPPGSSAGATDRGRERPRRGAGSGRSDGNGSAPLTGPARGAPAAPRGNGRAFAPGPAGWDPADPSMN